MLPLPDFRQAGLTNLKSVNLTMQVEEGTLSVHPKADQPRFCFISMHWPQYGERIIAVGLAETMLARAIEYASYGVPFGPACVSEDLQPSRRYSHDGSLRGTSPEGELRVIQLVNGSRLILQVPDLGLRILAVVPATEYATEEELWMFAHSLAGRSKQSAALLYNGTVLNFVACSYAGFFARCPLPYFDVFLRSKPDDPMKFLVIKAPKITNRSLDIVLGEISVEEGHRGLIWTLSDHPDPAANWAVGPPTGGLRPSVGLAMQEAAPIPPDLLRLLEKKVRQVERANSRDRRGRDRCCRACVAELLIRLAQHNVGRLNGVGPRFRQEMNRSVGLVCPASDRSLRYSLAHFQREIPLLIQRSGAELVFAFDDLRDPDSALSRFLLGRHDAPSGSASPQGTESPAPQPAPSSPPSPSPASPGPRLPVQVPRLTCAVVQRDRDLPRRRPRAELAERDQRDDDQAVAARGREADVRAVGGLRFAARAKPARNARRGSGRARHTRLPSRPRVGSPRAPCARRAARIHLTQLCGHHCA